MNVKTAFEIGTIINDSTLNSAENVDFIPHKSFKGVSLKLLLGGDKTGGALSLHLVRVEPNCCLENHVHPQNLEVHKIVGGAGTVVIGNSFGEYNVGSVGVIPIGMPHQVVAGEDGIYILATFSPALA